MFFFIAHGFPKGCVQTCVDEGWPSRDQTVWSSMIRGTTYAVQSAWCVRVVAATPPFPQTESPRCEQHSQVGPRWPIAPQDCTAMAPRALQSALRANGRNDVVLSPVVVVVVVIAFFVGLIVFLVAATSVPPPSRRPLVFLVVAPLRRKGSCGVGRRGHAKRE